MAIPYFYSDLHGGHKNIHKFRKDLGFTCEQDHWEFCEERFKKKVKKRDVVFCLGDMCFTLERLNQFSTWPGRKILICGNHDTDNISMRDIVKCYDEVHSLLKYKGFWLSHCPIHPDELRGKFNIHGHVHNHTLPDKRYFNSCLENINYEPISLDEVRLIFDKRVCDVINI